MSIEQGGENRHYTAAEWFEITHGRSANPNGDEPVIATPPTEEEMRTARQEFMDISFEEPLF